jgi:hypothetical protein
MSFPFLTGCKADNLSVATNTSLPTQITGENTPQTKIPSTSYQQQLTDGFMIAVAGRNYGSLFLIETGSGEYRKLEIPGEVGINVYGWSEDGCTLYVGTESNQIVQVDIEGNLKERLVDIDELAIDGKVIDIAVSPDEKWTALLSGTGQQGYATYEFQNMITVSVGGQPSKVYHLTNHGATRGVTWKPNGNLLAFNDNDNKGTQQIFISNPDGSEKSQLTDFDKAGFTIASLQWSPNGEKLAFVIIEESKNMSYLAITNTPLADKMINISTITDVNRFWWASNDIVVADVLPLGKNSNSATDRIIAWYDASTGKELGTINSTTTPNGIFEVPGPLTPLSKFGFFSGTGFYVYDIFSLQIEQLFNKFADSRYWISSPKPIDKAICGNEK